jgi:hypothetical protein
MARSFLPSIIGHLTSPNLPTLKCPVSGVHSNSSPTFLGYRSDEAQQYFSMGIGGMVVGGVLAIVGIVMMVVKKK